MNQIINILSKTKAKVILVGLIGLTFMGCATILHGTHQTLHVNSSPSGASVYIRHNQVGVTPASLRLERNKDYTLVFKKSGYKPVRINLNKNFKALPSILGNIFWSGVIGIVVDIVDGAAYKLSPEQVNANLKGLKNAGYLPGITKASKNDITVVMLTKKQWESLK